MAVLLSGNREVAEAALIDSLEAFSLDEHLDTSTLAAHWAEAVVKNIVQRLRLGSTAADDLANSDTLHPRLRDVTNLPTLPRIIFVLIVLLEYSLPKVAALTGLSKDRIRELLGEAAVLLAQKQASYCAIKHCGTSP